MSALATATGVVCPLCGWGGSEFLPQGRRARLNARCGGCNSLERHRAMYIFLRDRTRLLEKPARVLHFAPEEALSQVIVRAPLVDYITTDLEMEGVTLHMDIGDLLFKDGIFDCVICSHVLEHIPDDAAAMREIRRVLSDDGFALIAVPILSTPDGRTFEDPSIVTPEERERVYGQRDHVRIYGEDFPDRLRESGFEVEEVNPNRDLGPGELSTFGLLSDEQLFVCRRGENEPSRSPRPLLTVTEPDPVGFSTSISPGDTMARPERLDHYFEVGLGAIRLVENALQSAEVPEPRRILDLPSGHGRVMRMLRSRFPSAHLTACDLDREGIEFCITELGADAAKTPDELSPEARFDLIWCGSLLTHLPARACSELLVSFANWLDRDGVLVFTTHGDTIDAVLSSKAMKVAVDEARLRDLLERYRREGFGFAPYDHDATGEYGITLGSRAWIAEQIEAVPGLRMLSHSAGAWDGRQDLVTCQRVRS